MIVFGVACFKACLPTLSSLIVSSSACPALTYTPCCSPCTNNRVSSFADARPQKLCSSIGNVIWLTSTRKQRNKKKEKRKERNPGPPEKLGACCFWRGWPPLGVAACMAQSFFPFFLSLLAHCEKRMIMPLAHCVRRGTNPHAWGQIFLSFVCKVRSCSLLLSQAVSVGVINEKPIMNMYCLGWRRSVSGSSPPLNLTPQGLKFLHDPVAVLACEFQSTRSYVTTHRLANLFHW